MPILRYIGIAFAALFALRPLSSHAQGQGLRLERQLQPPSDLRNDLPVHVFGDRIDALGEDEVEVVGHAQLRKGDLRVDADRIRYSPRTDEVEATGNVHMHSNTIEVYGPRMRMRVNDQIGVLNYPRFETPPRLPAGATPLAMPVETRGTAQALRIEANERYFVTDGTFTTCKPGDDDWFLHADRFDLDYIGNVGEAEGVQLTFLGRTTPKVPWATFSLNNARKSGFLPPTFGLQGKVGAEITVPYYFNLAPNYDDTAAPRFTSKRGVQLNNEFRYLEPWGNGVVDAEYLPHDPVYNGSRYGLHTEDYFVLKPGYAGAYLHIDKVSDPNYFRDLSTSLPVATQVYLDQSAYGTYVFAQGWTGVVRLQHTQLLPDPTSNVPPTPQYDRLPQILLTGLQPGPFDSDFSLSSELVKFQAANLPTGERFIVNPALTFPYLTPGFYFKPKIGLHYTEYRLSNLAESPDPAVQMAGTTPHRLLPITSVDSGLTFERPLKWQGTDLIHTLEPRLFYVYIPYRNQEAIPVFDSSIPDISYASLFTENYYTGGDRISDANQLTVAAVSRFLRAETGQEVLRGFFGQRLYFSRQRVALGPSYPVRTDSSSSFIVGGSGQVLPRTTVDATGVFSSTDHSTQRLSAGIRYQPEPGKVLNLSWRYINATLNQVTDPTTGTVINQALKQIDVSGQWPIHGGLYAVGRYNYSIPDRTATEAVFGFEYNAGCWILRAVTQSFTTGVSSRTRLFFLQLELNGFSKLGANPLEVLRRSVSGYTALNQGNVDLQQLNLYGE